MRGGRTLAGGQAGRGDGDPEPHRAPVGHEHERGAARISAYREDGETAAEEGMGRVGYLDLSKRARAGFERGIRYCSFVRSPTTIAQVPGEAIADRSLLRLIRMWLDAL